MPRRPRLESSEHIYHIINRGNYRCDIFELDTTKKAFENTLWEACEKSHWNLFAYCIMSNHFHLAIATPQGNLVSGMQWLQSTFSNRYNRFRKEQGHLFQGRYKSLIVEPGSYLKNLVDYIHLNPYRAGIVNLDDLLKYPYSSLPKYSKQKRPLFMECPNIFADAIKPGRGFWRKYKQYLALKYSNDSKEIEKEDKQMIRGWCIGSKDYKEALVEDIQKNKKLIYLEDKELKEFNEILWQKKLKKYLKFLGKNKAAIKKDKKSAEWKIAVSMRLKETTSVQNAWLGKHLNMGSHSAVSQYVSSFKKETRSKSKYYNKIMKIAI